MKQKESSGAVTVPGRTRDNGELNGVLNGKSSVFSHRFNVIAALTPLRSAVPFAAVSPSCLSLLLCFVFVQNPPPPPTLHAQMSHSPLFAVSSRRSTFDLFSSPLSAMPPFCALLHHGPCRPPGYLIYRGQFSASCSQWDTRV